MLELKTENQYEETTRVKLKNWNYCDRNKCHKVTYKAYGNNELKIKETF